MKKMAFLALFLLVGSVKAETIFVTNPNPDPFSILGGQMKGALVTHVQAVDQVTSEGNKIALVDSILLIGHLKHDYLAHGRFGYNATRNPDGSYNGGGFQASLFFPLNNVLKSALAIPSQYQFLNGLQWGPSVGYDFGGRHDFISLDVGWQYGS